MRILMGLVLAAVIAGGIYLIAADNSPAANTNNMNTPTTALIETNYGNFKIQFYGDDAPKAVANFVELVGKKYYNGLIFHRVIRNFMIQGGDPNCGVHQDAGPCGAGGPGYSFEDELDPTTSSAQEGYKKGVVAMANSGPNTNGSQFFVMLADVPLPHQYTIFGKVIEGQEVVDAIGITPTSESDRPLEPAIINKVTVL